MIDLQRVSAALLVAVGFVMGIAFIASCGGSSGTSAAAAQGVEAVRHVTEVGPQSASSSFVLSQTLYTATYTPPDPNDVVLRISARGAYTTAATSINLHLSVRNGSHSATYGSVGQTLFAGTDHTFQIATAFDGYLGGAGEGAADGAYVIKLDVSNGDPGGSSIDVGALEIEVITLHGITRLDPSPFL